MGPTHFCSMTHWAHWSIYQGNTHLLWRQLTIIAWASIMVPSCHQATTQGNDRAWVSCNHMKYIKSITPFILFFYFIFIFLYFLPDIWHDLSFIIISLTVLNTLRPRLSSFCFTETVFQYTFLYGYLVISLSIQLDFFSRSSIDHNINNNHKFVTSPGDGLTPIRQGAITSTSAGAVILYVLVSLSELMVSMQHLGAVRVNSQCQWLKIVFISPEWFDTQECCIT